MSGDAAIAAERDRIRLAMFACRRCGKIHEYRQVSRSQRTWATDDHDYEPAYVSASGGWKQLLLGTLSGAP